VVAAAACGGSGGGGAAGAVKGTGKNYTLSKESDFKYDLIKIDGQDYVRILEANLPEGFKKLENGKYLGTALGVNAYEKVIVDTLTLKIPEKIEGYAVGAIGTGDAWGNRIADPCEAVVAVTIPDTVIQIAYGAFQDAAISSIKLPKNLKTLGKLAFSGCKNLGGKLVIPEGVTEIPEVCFTQASITEVTIPESVTSIGWSAFSECKELTTVKLPSHPIKYGSESGNRVFTDCGKLSLATRKAIEESGYTGGF
jgi:hypothetical protein